MSEIVWVERDGGGAIKGVYANMQPGYAEEQLPADDPEVVAFLKPKRILLSTVEWVGRFTNAEYRAATAAAWRGSGPNAKNWDVVALEDAINLSNQKTATLKQSLVTDGILTQVRADEIFAPPPEG